MKAEGREEDALALALHAWQKARTPEIALWLGELLPPPQAIPSLFAAVQGLPGETRPRLLLAQACHAAGRTQDARRHLLLARMLCASIDQAEAFCETAWRIGETEEALALVGEKLEHSPASVDYLRLRYLCLRRLGREKQAERTLQTLLEIDPDDAAALHYRRRPEDLALPRMDLLSALGSLVYARPQYLRSGPLNRTLHLMVMFLSEQVSIADIYRLLPPLWRRLSPAERRACDRESQRAYPIAIALYLLLRTGQSGAAAALLRRSPNQKRIFRLIRRFDHIMTKE